MSEAVIKVENLSKAYRIGVEEKKPDTFAGSILQSLKAPLKNFRDLKNLRKFDRDEASIFWALRDVNFEVNEGEVLGIVGRNGAGKSTLLKILSRITEPSSGSATIHGRVSSLLEVGTGFHPDLTGRENIYMNGTILGMRKKEIDLKLDEIISFSGIEKHIDTPVKRYSSGMTVRLAFSVAAHLEPEILIIDEVLAVGDFEFQRKCLGKMKDVSGQGRTVLFVSHNMGAVKSLCTKGLLLDKGTVKFSGTVDETIRAYVINRESTGEKGVVQKHMRTHSTGEVFIRKLTIVDEENIGRNDIYYKDEIDIQLEIEVIEAIKDSLLDIRIISEEGIVVAQSLSAKASKTGIDLPTGRHMVAVKLANHLAPGNYSLTGGVHFPNGMTIDFVEDVYPFTVLKVARDEGNSYPFEWVFGYQHPESKWKLVNK